MTEAVLVMMNNYFHDLAVAFLFASCLLSHVVVGYWPGKVPDRVAAILLRTAWGSLAFVLAGGAVRVWFYREYEWLPKAGTAQLPALGVKHMVLLALTIWGIYGVLKLRRMTKEGGASGEQA